MEEILYESKNADVSFGIYKDGNSYCLRTSKVLGPFLLTESAVQILLNDKELCLEVARHPWKYTIPAYDD